MHRNLNRRVETLFPIDDPLQRLRARREFLESAASDNTKIRWLQADGTYLRAIPNGATPHNCQEELMATYQASPSS